MKNDITAIYNELKKGITQLRLKEISVDIIRQYKERNRTGLIFYARLLDLDTFDININKLFAMIIQHYHPDKILKIVSEIESHYNNNKTEELISLRNAYLYSARPPTTHYEHDVEITETYSYDEEEFGYDEKSAYGDDIHYDDEYSGDDNEETFDGHDYGFMEAITSLIFGNLDYTINVSDLYNLEGELDLSDFEINEIEGIKHCIHITSLNLSGNHIIKIEPVSLLTKLEYLFISENFISNIDCLSALHKLKELDISFNEIEDISVLSTLENLNYVNVMGNPIKDTGIFKDLADKGVIVIY